MSTNWIHRNIIHICTGTRTEVCCKSQCALGEFWQPKELHSRCRKLAQLKTDQFARRLVQDKLTVTCYRALVKDHGPTLKHYSKNRKTSAKLQEYPSKMMEYCSVVWLIQTNIMPWTVGMQLRLKVRSKIGEIHLRLKINSKENGIAT